jgi:putative membrane protein
MNRRSIVGLIIAVPAISPAVAFAQSSASTASLEDKHAAETLEAGAVALETSKIALAKATDINVKRFAQFEAAEQEAVASVVKAVSRFGDDKLSATDQATADRLNAMPAGKEFDQAYVKGQIEGHQKLLQIQEAYLSAGKEVTHRTIATLARGHIKEHLSNLEQLQKPMAG